jgi:hypothetical protein
MPKLSHIGIDTTMISYMIIYLAGFEPQINPTISAIDNAKGRNIPRITAPASSSAYVKKFSIPKLYFDHRTGRQQTFHGS